MKKFLCCLFAFVLIGNAAYAQVGSGVGSEAVGFWTSTDDTTIAPFTGYTTINIAEICDENDSNCNDVSAGLSGAPTDATYITQTANGSLSAEQALSSLTTGVVKVTNGTGVLSTAVEGTDYYGPSGTDVALADGGTGASLSDPNADRILFWDDSESATAFLSTGNGLTITTTSIAADTASDTVDGVVELAIASEVTTGTDTARAITPDALAGSDFGKKRFGISLFESDAAVATGDGKVGIPVDSSLDGFNVVNVQCNVYTKGVTGTTDVVLRRQRGATDVDVTSTAVTIGDEYFAADSVINTSNDDLATGDMLFFDVNAIHSGTAPNGLSCVGIAQRP